MCSDEHGMDARNGNLNMDLNRENMDTVKAVSYGMDSGPGTYLFVDPKVVEGVDKPVLEILPNVKVSTILKSFASLVTNDAATSKGFFFKFASIEGMNRVMENGPWFIRLAPINMKKWTQNANLLKEDMNLVPIWVKFHDIPIVTFTADKLSVMATKLGDELGSNEGSSNSGMKFVKDVVGSASGSPSNCNTPKIG
nr:hypothetical protein [Tanacetum cinerariifolium]